MNKAQQKAYNYWRRNYAMRHPRYPDELDIEAAFEAGLNYKKKTDPELKAKAINIITFLNERTGKKSGKGFPLSETNLTVVMARLKEGFTEDEIRQVIVLKSRDDFFKENKLLRPSTLFGKTKFSNYVGELGG